LKLTSNRVDFGPLIRIITKYSGTKSYLFKIGVSESSSCRYEEISQNLNHIFWACSLLKMEREAMYKLETYYLEN